MPKKPAVKERKELSKAGLFGRMSSEEGNRFPFFFLNNIPVRYAILRMTKTMMGTKKVKGPARINRLTNLMAGAPDCLAARSRL